MRVIPQPGSGPVRPEAAPHSVNGPAPVRFIREAIRNSPWVVIAATAHIIGIAVLSVVYVATHQPTQVETPGVVSIRPEDPPQDPAPEVKPTDFLPVDAVPPPPEGAKEGPRNPDEVVDPLGDPGRAGPVTDSTDVTKAPGQDYDGPDATDDPLTGAPGGTSIGVGRHGHPGLGIPSTTVTRFPGRGRGKGGLGQGGGNGPGGSRKRPPEDVAVLDALKWLRNHQSPDGRWDCDGFDAACKLNRCDGPGEATHDVGVTGLSLLAFLGAGETHQSGACKETVKSALRYLRDVQDSEGCFGPRTSQHFLYDHACASLAMTEAYGMTSARLFKEPAQRGIGFVLRARNPYLAWRYNVPADGDNDMSVTGWMVMALKSARMSGLDVEKQPIEDALVWVERMTEPEFGRTGYQQRGGPPARTNEAMAKFPNSKSEALTAVGLTCRIFGGRDTKSDPMIDKGADLLVKSLPRWDVDQGTIDFYYWYYGSLAMFQVGGPRWHKWNESVKTALLDHQRKEKDRCEFGSWDPLDPWSTEGGRVYATAINCLTMEVYYRYPVLGVKAEK
jgi:hypothetical protein